MKSFFSEASYVEERSASSTARHRHRISVKSKGADLVARKLATKFGEKAEAAARHKGNRFAR